ncbi:hypothetical protein LOCC1_G001646 [Lachnellula occidentalis]|uniref:Integral membrane protein n=1 Tax=Lachnellula occidentalis TaxID=215460 RepID=A0A8H8SAK3_9HELO|nr:hypothetical protein LOCC1_G001646 [Lachnellula occidentalis]
MHSSDYLAICILPLLFSCAGAQTADGAIVPFSTLPTCAAKCGPLYDVQGACAPPAQSSVNQNCFCTDTRLTPFSQGTSEVASVCGAASCSAASDLQALQTWYEGYCKGTTSSTSTGAAGATTTTGAAGSSTKTSTGSSGSGSKSSNGNPSWFDSHVKWVVMLIVLAIGIPAVWIAAIILRRRYIRKRDREIEMRPPVALGPHQIQAMSGGYSYGDGVVDQNGKRSDVGGRGPGTGSGGHSKDMSASTSVPVATPADGRKEKTGWLQKARR